jgi:hypothetical protein
MAGALGFTVELSRGDRLILATASTTELAWQLAERAAVGNGDEYDD